VEAAHGELLKLFNMVQGNRSLILKIFLVLVLVIFLFVVVF
jgi:syntaxin 5